MGDDGLVYFNIEYLFYAVYSLFAGTPQEEGVTVVIETPEPEKVVEVSGVSPDAVALWDIFTITMIVVSLLLAVGIVYAVIRMSQIRHRAREASEAHKRSTSGRVIGNVTPTTPMSGQSKEKDADLQKRWLMIQAEATSPDPRGWRQALEKADQLLKESPHVRTLSREELAPVETWRVYTKEGSDEILTQARTQEALVKYETLFKKLGHRMP